MNKIIVSINPRHVNNIINGSKRYEYRTRIASKDADKLLIYETAPTKNGCGRSRCYRSLIA